MSLKKRFALGSLLFLLLGSVAACGDDAHRPSSEALGEALYGKAVEAGHGSDEDAACIGEVFRSSKLSTDSLRKIVEDPAYIDSSMFPLKELELIETREFQNKLVECFPEPETDSSSDIETETSPDATMAPGAGEDNNQQP